MESAPVGVNDISSKVEPILDYRINIDSEFQGWILIFATVTAVWLFCLPCYCAGMSWTPARKFASWISQRLPFFYACMTTFNVIFLYLVIAWLPDYSFPQYIAACITFLAWTVGHLLKWSTSIAMIIAFIVAVAFKDRIALMLGMDHKQIFNCKARDCLNCWTTTRFRPIELMIWKVEDLPSADLFNANNVFVELFMGYNETMKTRVHNNAGSDCILKETVQLNFDEDDDEEKLFIFVKNQQVMGAQELARAEVPVDQLKSLVQRVPPNGGVFAWNKENFRESITLVPRGRIWLKAVPVDEENFSMSSYTEDMPITC